MFRPDTCFVIMPFGLKKDSNGKDIDFDTVYKKFTKPLVERLGFECHRCDDLDAGGPIHLKMFEHVYGCGMTLVDLTTANPNVMYELGARHALVRAQTVMIKQEGTVVPFNIQGYEAIDYSPNDPDNKDTGFKAVKRRIKKLIDHYQSQPQHTDSPVHSELSLRVQESGSPTVGQSVYCYKVRGQPADEIRLITGELMDVKNVDIWVSSENTHMQMARYLERSISSTIRYGGAEKNGGKIVQDTVSDELKKELGGRDQAEAGEILVTGPGELATTNAGLLT